MLSRRQLLSRCGMGFGVLALPQLLDLSPCFAADRALANPLTLRQPHFPATAKHVIHLFMNGGPSHIDTFDPKPTLHRLAGQQLPGGNLATERPTGAALPSPYKFRRHGQSGIEVSEIFPHVAALQSTKWPSSVRCTPMCPTTNRR